MFLKDLLSKRGGGTEEKTKALVEKIQSLYETRNDLGIKELIKTHPINLLVGSLEEIDDEQIAIRFLVNAYRIKMGELFLALGPTLQTKMLNSMKAGVFSHLLEDLNSDDVYELYQNSSNAIQKKIIFNASKQLKKEIKQLKEFGFAEAGSIMNATYVTVSSQMTIAESIDFLKENHQQFDIGEEIFVLDEGKKVVGTVDVKKLFLTNLEKAEEDKVTRIGEIAEKSFMSVHEEEDIDEIIDLFKKYSIRSLAVIDKEQRMVGIIDYQDIIPEILDSNVEDFYKLYGIRETQRSYLNSSILEIVKSRITCLILMLVFATLTTYAIDQFESRGVVYTAGISTAILVPIIPIITDVCGNTGSQTTATIIQAYSSGELRETDFWTAIKKELKISVSVGAILAAVNFLRLIVYFLIFQNKADFQSKVHANNGVVDKLTETAILKISLVGALSSSLSLWIVVIFSKFFGVLIPLMAIKFNYDPAAVSAPILTTILDTVASVIFFGIGVWILKMAINPIIGVNVENGRLVSQTAAAINHILANHGSLQAALGY